MRRLARSLAVVARRARPAAVLAGLALLASCVQIHNTPPGQGPDAGQDGGPQQARAAQQQEGDQPFEEWSEVLEDTREVPGFLTVHLERDNTLFLEIPKDRLGQDFGMVLHYSRGLGDMGIQEGLWADSETHLLRFRREGDQIYLVRRNPRFVADAGSAMETAMEGNVGHSVVASFDIESEHQETGNLLVEATDFFVSDYAATGEVLSQFAYGGRPVRLSDDRSHVEKVRGFPDNVEVDAFLTFQASDAPQSGGPGVSDYRSVPVGVRYSLFRLPEDPMDPRPADQRVGHFLTAHEDFSADQSTDPMRRYVNRWRLEKKDHSKDVSEPVEPIVYYIDRSVPERYRPYVEEGIEAWNEAFREAGYRNAIVAKVAPTPAEDSTWSAEDVRYSTVQWTAAHNMGYAIGPSEVDPRTGEILNADILISWRFVQGWLQQYQNLVAGGSSSASGGGAGFLSGRPNARGDAGSPAWDAWASAGAAVRSGPAGALARYRRVQRSLLRSRPEALRHLCAAELYKAHELGVQYATLAARGVIDPGEELPEEYLGAAIKELVMHEVGHTLGLRHNFKASTDIPYERLHDESFTGQHGVSLSVMEYNPVNLALDEDRQGHYWNPTVGTYDRWAIRYAYAPAYAGSSDGGFATSGTPVTADSAERAALATIAGKSDDPLHAYGTDEDAGLGPYSVDPLTNTGDLGSDPLRFMRDRDRIVDQILPRVEDRVVEDDRPWHRLRQAVTSLIFDKWISMLDAPKMVGGMYVARDYRGQPGARPPFRHVPAERQREAVRLLAEEAFGPDALQLDPATLNRLAPDRWSDWTRGFTDVIPMDFPVHRQVLFFQDVLLSQLLHPERLHRLVDDQVRTPDGVEPFGAGELFGQLSAAIWAELRQPRRPEEIDSFRRNLQRAYLERLQTLLLHEAVQGFGGEVTIPEDARSLARVELSDLSETIATALEAGDDLSPVVRAHLEESKARIDRALEASLVIDVGG